MGRRVLGVAVLASFVAFLDGAIVTVALPAMDRELGGGLSTQQWVVDAYLLTLGSLILIAGSLSDTFGRVRILRAGLLLFGAASLACAVAPNALTIIAARAVQGAGGALLVPSSLALITSMFDGGDRARAIGSWTAWTGTAFLAGPLLGGLLVDYAGWRYIFAINVLPIAATLWLLRRLVVPGEGLLREAVPRTSSRVDVPGAVLASVGLAGTVFALISAQPLGWGSPAVAVPLAVGLAALAGLLWWERRAPEPMMPLGLFTRRNFGIGNLATAFIYAASSLGPLILVLFLQEVAGFSAALAGLASMPTAVVMLLLSGFFGKLSGRYGPRLFMAAGPLVAALGYLLMSGTGVPFNFWLHILPVLLVFSLGMTVTVAPLTAAILGAVPPAQSGIGSAINNAVARVAGLIAVALAGTVLGGVLDAGTFGRAALATAVLFAAGGAVSALGITNKVGGKVVKQEADD